MAPRKTPSGVEKENGEDQREAEQQQAERDQAEQPQPTEQSQPGAVQPGQPSGVQPTGSQPAEQVEQEQEQQDDLQEGELPPNLVEPEGVEEQRQRDLEVAEENAVEADVSVDTRQQAFMSSHVPGPAGATGHPGFFPDQYTDGDVNYGSFCVVGGDGPNAGLYGVYIDNVSSGDSGLPDVVLVRERNSGRVVSVKYDDLEPAAPGDIGRGR